MNESARPRRPSATLVLFLLVAVLAVLAADRYVVLHNRLGRLERSSRRTALVLARLEARRLTRSALARAEGAWSVRFATLAAREKHLARTLAKLRALGPGRRGAAVAVAEARELLAFARDEGRIAARPRASASLLFAAARLLASVPEASLQGLAARLRAAAALRARLPAFPYARARLALRAVRRGLLRPPPAPFPAPRPPRPPAPVVHGFWAKIWSAVVRFVHATVRIETIPRSGMRAKRLTSGERRRLAESLRLDLATARLALDARDPKLFQTLARSVVRDVRILYGTSDPALSQATEALARLVARPPPPRPPSLAPLRRALAAAERALVRT